MTGWIIFGSVVLLLVLIFTRPVKVTAIYDANPEITVKILCFTIFRIPAPPKKRKKPKKQKKKKREKQEKQETKETQERELSNPQTRCGFLMVQVSVFPLSGYQRAVVCPAIS